MDNVLRLRTGGASRFEVWLDTGMFDEHDGLCIGTGDTAEAAILSAAVELKDAIQQLWRWSDPAAIQSVSAVEENK